MSLLTIGSLVAGVATIIIGILLGGNLMDFVNLESIFITVIGTFAATIMCFPAYQLKNALKAMKFAFQKPASNQQAEIDNILRMARVARKGGLLALEYELGDNTNRFVKKGIMLIVDGSTSKLVKSVMETEINNIYDRHGQACAVFRRAAVFAPAFGMIGTLIGLINMLTKLNDPSTLGPAMAVALITTFYGSVMANMFFLPIACRLDIINDDEALNNRIFLEGILSIQAGDNPRIIQEKLEAFIATSPDSNQSSANSEAAEE